MFVFYLPDPGEGLLEADITQWFVAVGDDVKVNDILLEIETAKSLVELPSPVSGVVTDIFVKEGQTVNVGTPIIQIDDGSNEPGITTGDDAATEESDKEQPKNLVGSGPKPEATKRSTAAVSSPITTAVGKVLAKPLVRRLARDLGIDLSTITPTGPHGTVSQEDVELAAGLGAADGTRQLASKVRRATADNVLNSVTKHVHVTEFNTIDVTRSMEMVDTIKAHRAFRDLRVSPLLLWAKAVVAVLPHYPTLNSSWDAATQEIITHHDVNLGIAAATPRGLMVPVIRRANTLSLVELCQSLNAIVQTAREGKLQPADYSGGTFTITNVGVFGIDTGTPIINGDESAILAMGAIKRQPWVVGSGDDERIEPRSVSTLALSFDHQLIDGEDGSKFLRDVCSILESPENIMLF